MILVSASVVFFTLFELAGSALNQFAERNTQLPSDGFFSISSGQTQAFNAGFILLCAPLFAMMWNWMNRTRRDIGDPAKFALGLIQVGAGFLVLVWGAQFADESARVPLVFLILLYLLHTTGELFLSPVGLSAMTKLAPAAVVSTMMATWFLASSAAQALAAQIAKLTAQETVGGQVLDPQAALATYVDVFNRIGWAAIGIGVVLGVLSPFLRRLAHTDAADAREPAAEGKARDGKLALPFKRGPRRAVRLPSFSFGGRELVDERQQLVVAAGHGAVGRVLAVDDDRRDAADAVPSAELVGALQLGLHGERIERSLERSGVDTEAAEELLQLRLGVEPVTVLVNLAEKRRMHLGALAERLRRVEGAGVDHNLGFQTAGTRTKLT